MQPHQQRQQSTSESRKPPFRLKHKSPLNIPVASLSQLGYLDEESQYQVQSPIYNNELSELNKGSPLANRQTNLNVINENSVRINILPKKEESQTIQNSLQQQSDYGQLNIKMPYKKQETIQQLNMMHRNLIDSIMSRTGKKRNSTQMELATSNQLTSRRESINKTDRNNQQSSSIFIDQKALMTQ
ncbi:UNKNOWN [Stylonychia lemnae]|uniref:Uncharacterized protein n=1 Tax=Stylonychia lemnae TaxID=5949 RepID=A0A078A759_STYLE|nr:UNKNOWN [Stylonychia lemnae]|eukprot:CDW78084.1 UNKNOWN [Stylonychia lemnae]